jgi:hypothetical protein
MAHFASFVIARELPWLSLENFDLLGDIEVLGDGLDCDAGIDQRHREGMAELVRGKLTDADLVREPALGIRNAQ